MEINFQQKTCPYLNTLVQQIQTQEQTQEVRLSDGMPDVGRILGCWGQPLVRSKEWRSGEMVVSGGVMAWVLYAPEDGSQVRCVDAWVPFQMKWSLPDTNQDGTIRVHLSLKGMDCRNISARKMMIRPGISAMGEAFTTEDAEIYVPEELPQDVHLLKSSYPLELPQEAGEKAFALEEEISLPGTAKKIMCCQIMPSVTEQKVLGDKMVFRGTCRMHILYLTEDGQIKAEKPEFGFSQFAELDRLYGNYAMGNASVLPTGMESELDENGKLILKCGLAAQYVIFDRTMMELVEDAYSNVRKVTPVMQMLKLPVKLDSVSQQVPYEQTISVDGSRVLDVTCQWELPGVRQSENTAKAVLAAQYHLLYEDEEGQYQSSTAHGEISWEMPSDDENCVMLNMRPSYPEGMLVGDGVRISGEIQMSAEVFSSCGMPMVTGLELGEQVQPDVNRPAVILRKVGGKRLWDLAKECSSTVEAIEKANALGEIPLEEEKILLIPVC